MKLTSAEMEKLCATIPGTCMPREVALLYELCGQAPKVGWFVELGSYLGRSAIALCQAAREEKRDRKVMLIDNFSYHEETTPDKLALNLSRYNFWPVIIDGDTRVKPNEIWPGDMVALLFVDSNHTATHFEAEMDTWQPWLMSGAVIACHDYGSPRWLEMTGVINKRLGHLQRIGFERRLIAFRWGA